MEWGLCLRAFLTFKLVFSFHLGNVESAWLPTVEESCVVTHGGEILAGDRVSTRSIQACINHRLQ